MLVIQFNTLPEVLVVLTSLVILCVLRTLCARSRSKHAMTSQEPGDFWLKMCRLYVANKTDSVSTYPSVCWCIKLYKEDVDLVDRSRSGCSWAAGSVLRIRIRSGNFLDMLM